MPIAAERVPVLIRMETPIMGVDDTVPRINGTISSTGIRVGTLSLKEGAMAPSDIIKADQSGPRHMVAHVHSTNSDLEKDSSMAEPSFCLMRMPQRG